MMTPEQINKKMPFDEKEGYVEQLVERATEKAIQEGTSTHTRLIPLRRAAAIAASVLLLGGAATIWYMNKQDDKQSIAQIQNAQTHTQTAQQQDPLGKFLNSISDEEAQQIQFYEIEETYY